MASSANLFIDPDGVRGAGAGLSGASSPAAAPPPVVTPCAADATSVKVALALSTSISELLNATATLNHKTAQAAARMNRNATTYEDQERVNAASLAAGSRGRAASVPTSDGPSIAPPLLVAPRVPTPGVQPTSGREIAALMHGGPGTEALESAAQALNAHADQLDSAAQSVRSARWTSEQNWDSAAADQASTHLATLESTYTRHADQSRALSRDATVQANNFRQARANIPTPQHFTELEQRLRSASAANANNGGRYAAVVAKLQTDLAAAHQQAVNTYSTYTAGGQVQAEPLQPGAATTTTQGASGQGEPGVAPGTEDGSQPGTGDAGAAPAADALGDPTGGGDLMQTLLPTVFGVVAGAAGGLLGALSGAADKVQQTGTQLVSGLAQGGASALQGLAGGQPGGSDPSSGEGNGLGDLGDLGDGGGGGGSEPGDTEPASGGDGALAAAPASAAAAPAAAPAPTVGTGAPTLSSTGTGTGTGMGGAPIGGMMPPMMGAPGRGGGGEDDKRLYEEKRLRLTTPPNSEPVKGRVEAREARPERRETRSERGDQQA
ncbi:PPE domain-containing protein [Mycolicibacterium vinylchloridicum]|uniref:PPE domain-containing protein n=1 Tax=Mycolicibacterium vinylchloridicum TaxID=2736928 RepID=UPI00022E3D72|nr:PPE domain-containing protein [Mycolicibacterium vinylchloridicum]EHB46434.1 PPE protein [Mycolicibacterium rhodesiae JS60]